MIPTGTARSAWNRAKRPWTHVRLNEPRIYAAEEAEGLNDTIAHINLRSKRVEVDESNLETKIGSDLLSPILSHEVGHHKLCPYDLRGLARLIGAAYDELGNMEQAKFAENLFADLLVNTHLYRRKEQEIVEAYRRLAGGKDDLWNFAMATYERMIGQPTTLTPRNLDPSIIDDATRCAKTLDRALYASNRWTEAMREFARTARTYLRSDHTHANAHEPSDFIPVDVSDAKGLRAYLRRALRGIGREMSPKAYGAVLREIDRSGRSLPSRNAQAPSGPIIAARPTGRGNAPGAKPGSGHIASLPKRRDGMRWYYEDLAEAYLVQMPKATTPKSMRASDYPRRWRTSDPIERLDVEYSLTTSGVLIPNLTTYQRAGRRGRGALEASEPSDLLIVLDSSGSMPDPGEQVSYPVVSAFVAATSAIEQQRYVGVINFSQQYSTTPFTMEKDRIAKALLLYYGQGTRLPLERMERAVHAHKHPTHVLMISDARVGQLEAQAGRLAAIREQARGGATLFVNHQEDADTSVLERAGYRVVLAGGAADLPYLSMSGTADGGVGG